MAIAGVGAGINELTALAATSEMAPTRKRGKYVAMLVFTVCPWAASVLWGQLIAYHAGWRYVGLVCGIWAGIALAATLLFYHPPPRINSKGLSKMEVIQHIDFIGGILSISGMVLFLAGLVWGGYQVCKKEIDLPCLHSALNLIFTHNCVDESSCVAFPGQLTFEYSIRGNLPTF